MSEEEKSLSVQCPVCSKKQDVLVPTRVVKDNIKGVSTIAINATCGHSFHIFVDKNFSIRGYQRSDFDITATAGQKEVVQDLSLPGIVRMFGDESFAYATHALLLNKKAILVGSDQQILKSLFINFIALFERELGESADVIEIMSKDEFNNLDPSTYINDLVIDLDFSVLKNNPFKNDKVKIEKDILKSSLNIKDINSQKRDFKEKLSRIFLYANIILNFIYSGKNNFKEIKKMIKQKDSSISQKELELAYTIANDRYANLL